MGWSRRCPKTTAESRVREPGKNSKHADDAEQGGAGWKHRDKPKSTSGPLGQKGLKKPTAQGCSHRRSWTTPADTDVETRGSETIVLISPVALEAVCLASHPQASRWKRSTPVTDAPLGLVAPAGKKTGKASLKVWQFGEMSLRTISDAIDYGQAASLTRMGTIGESTWGSGCTEPTASVHGNIRGCLGFGALSVVRGRDPRFLSHGIFLPLFGH